MIRFLSLAAVLAVPALFAIEPPVAGNGVPVTTVVTMQAKKGENPPQLTRDDLLVSQDKHRVPIADMEPLHNLQLWVLIDDGISKDLGLQYPDLRKFMQQQRPGTEIGVGYMRNGSVQVTQPATADHDLAGKALRIPIGPPGISASPYIALADFIKHWPGSGSQAREVVLLTNGVDPLYGPGPDNPYVTSAIDTAQRAGVIVYTIDYRGAGRFGGRGSFWGQNYMAQVSEATSGEFYWQASQEPVSLAPYLEDLNHRLNEQYLVTFLANAGSKAGLQNIKVSTDLPRLKVTAPARVFVPAS